MQWPSKKVCAFVAAGTLLLGGGATAAYASIPDANGTIHGCRDGAGNVRIIDAPTESCLTGETEVDWSASTTVSTYFKTASLAQYGTLDCDSGDLLLSAYFGTSSPTPVGRNAIRLDGSSQPIGVEAPFAVPAGLICLNQ